MDEEEAQSLDAELRRVFLDSDCPPDCEFGLKRELVLQSRDLLPSFPYLVMHEWEVWPGASQFGKGDLVFTDGLGRYAAVEVKFLPLRSGPTARKKRNKSRNKVRDQALRYASVVAGRQQSRGPVLAFIYTNDLPYGLVEVGSAVWAAEE